MVPSAVKLLRRGNLRTPKHPPVPPISAASDQPGGVVGNLTAHPNRSNDAANPPCVADRASA
jgi:hypothetical protein